MANYARRVTPQRYDAVPQSPRSAGPSRQSSQNHSYSNQPSMAMPQPMVAQGSYRPPLDDRQEAARRVATGQLGGGYGPYSVRVLTSSSLGVLSAAATHTDPAHYSFIPTSMPANTLHLALAMVLVLLPQKCLSLLHAKRRAPLL